MTLEPNRKCLGNHCGIREACARYVEKADGHEMVTIAAVAQGADCKQFLMREVENDG